MSENSSARTCVTLRESADTMSGKRSVMPPGWMPVPCSVTPPARHAASSSATLGRSFGIEPAERRHDVLARLEDPRSPRSGLAEDRAVERRSRRRARAARRRRSSRARRSGRCPRARRRRARLLGAVHPAADELELGVREDALDRGASDAAGRPLDDAVLHDGSDLAAGARKATYQPRIVASSRVATRSVEHADEQTHLVPWLVRPIEVGRPSRVRFTGVSRREMPM